MILISEVFTPAPIEAFVEVFVSQGVQGPPGLGTTFVVGETPTGAVDSSNMDYTTAGSFSLLWVWLNGLRMKEGVDYNISGADSFSFTYPPTTGDTLQVDYAA